eukprot:scaffold25881_cov129-Isochrysis_galbana.AAC.4
MRHSSGDTHRSLALSFEIARAVPRRQVRGSLQEPWAWVFRRRRTSPERRSATARQQRADSCYAAIYSAIAAQLLSAPVERRAVEMSGT